MKRKFPFLAIAFLLLVNYELHAQYIPDANFRQAINTQCPTCIDGNGYLKPDAQTLTSLLADNGNIADITGVDGFLNLEQFFCSQNQLTFLPNLPDSLNTFYCNDNLLSSLPLVLPSKLKEFKCEDNQLSVIPELPAKLVLFFCSGNSLTQLPSLPPTLENLTCNDNQLTYLPPLPEGLTSVHCNINSIQSLPKLPSTISKIFCSQNQITSLPELPLTLDLLDVSANPISCLPKLPLDIETLNTDFTYIGCLPNIPTAFELNPPLPLCVSDSDVSCAANPLISGNVFIDYDGNGFKDVSDISVSGMQISADADNFLGITDNNGNYEMKAGFGNSYTISPIEPAGNYTVNPASYTLTFDDSSNQVISNANFSLVPDGNNYDLETTLAIGETTQGGQTICNITYTNNSAYVIDGTIQLIFDSHLNYLSAVPQPDGVFSTTLTFDFAALAPFDSRSINVVFNVAGNAIAGTILTNSVNSTLLNHTDLVPGNNIETISIDVKESFIPNTITVNYDSITPNEIWDGKILEYVLNYQNTGSLSVNRFEIYDTLSSFLDSKSLEILASTFNYSLEILNADYTVNHPLVLHFTFDNVNLPSVNSDAIASQGLLSFKIRPRSDVSLNTFIYNKAEILFDYSSIALSSNQVFTVIAYPVSVENILGNENISAAPNPFTSNIMVTSNFFLGNEIKLSIYDCVGRKVFEQNISPAKNTTLDLSSLAPGAYLLEAKNADEVYSAKIFKQ